ncbi:hypothetical protein [Streptomyces solincola]|nr:hypothetical protein [Streptomyces solincola]
MGDYNRQYVNELIERWENADSNDEEHDVAAEMVDLLRELVDDD